MKSQYSIYLAGPIAGCSDEECNGWRNHIISKLSSFYKIYNPMNRDYREHDDADVNKIVEEDKADILNSDIVLVNYPKPSAGTCMEIIFSWENGKYVIIISPPGTILSPWVKYHSNKIFHSFDTAIEFLRKELFVKDEV